MRPLIILSALSLALAVALGAFGAHAWKEQLANGGSETFRTGTLYHFAHGFGGLIAGLAAEQSATPKFVRISGWLFLVGTLFFSGSLYSLALGGPRWLGAVAPLGGSAFILGWIFFACAWGKSK